jgi:hypothetical protein
MRGGTKASLDFGGRFVARLRYRFMTLSPWSAVAL